MAAPERTVFLLPTIVIHTPAAASPLQCCRHHESLSFTVVGYAAVYGIFKISKLVLPTVERMHERTLATRGPPARQETIELVSAENGRDA